MTAPSHRTVDSQGLSIHCLEWGDPTGEPVVLVHGFLDQAQSWKFFVAELLERAERPLWIIAPDCRGHGDSGWVGAGGYYHFPDYVYDLDCVVRTLGLTRFSLIGHSMGGTISFLYAGTFPERLAHLVLIEGVGPPGMDFADAPSRMAGWIGDWHERGRNHFREYTSIKAGATQLQQTNPRLKKEFAVDLAHTGMKQNNQRQMGLEIRSIAPHRRAAAVLHGASAGIFPTPRMPGADRRRRREPPEPAYRQTAALRRHPRPPNSDRRPRRPYGPSR